MLPGDYGDHVTGAVMAVPGGFFTYGEGGEGFTPDVSLDIYSDAATHRCRASASGRPATGTWSTSIFGAGPGDGRRVER